ncbi:hypothetical protein QWJ41_04180 [Nocardioides sp. SOB44]|uniref:Phage major capsid protein n=1 Tax=Nocardioides cremeus TaxID=3058044 RepID=A0ABT8TNG6_9ACTN|nr:hypothetical protein [Nocardioides cremeus]MDO3394904.1 hypothetical protein [Nocardioides cremeus]
MSKTETQTIEQILELQRTRADALRQINDLRKSLRASTSDADAEARSTAQQAYDEAAATVQETKAALAEQKALLERQQAQQKAGDRSVTAASVRATKDEIETLTNYLGHDQKTLQQAERTLRPLAADEHLAHLAADLIESVTDVPVVVRKVPAEAPDIEPLIVVSQTTPTEDYGTLSAAGSVRLTAKGTEVPVKALRDAFEDAGCEGQVTQTGITFDRAMWPLPRLAEPSIHGIASWMSDFEQAWGLQISGAREAETLRARGFGARVKTLWEGLFDRMTTNLDYEGGKATGTATFRVAAQQERGPSMEIPDLKTELREVFGIFQRETIGAITEAGEVVSVEMSDVTGVNHNWPSNSVAHRMGGAIQPTTAEATVTVEFAYSPTEEV